MTQTPDDETQSYLTTYSVLEKQVIFATSKDKVKSDYYLRGDPVSLIITNVLQWQGGRSNPWGDADKSKMGLRDDAGQGIAPVQLEDQFKPQSFNDGLLEITAASSLTQFLL